MSSYGIMFHHFHDNDKHITSQGSISCDEFEQMILFLKADFEILDADMWFNKAMIKELESYQICLTFDDALACQYDIAYPVLKKYGIKAFWFIYTSIYKGILEKLEIYRHFRFSSFDSIVSFYNSFFKIAISNQEKINIDIDQKIKLFNPDEYLQQHSFYTTQDRIFRYLRDVVLGSEKYHFIMDGMMTQYGYDIEKNKELLWITEKQILDLHSHGHIIGLHSHTHPTVMAEKTYDEQMSEYRDNKVCLESIIGSKVFAISYPCGSYNRDTDKIMGTLGIQLGFDAIMSCNEESNQLHFSRKDHAYVIKEMAK